jgi:hypothetical protein
MRATVNQLRLIQCLLQHDSRRYFCRFWSRQHQFPSGSYIRAGQYADPPPAWYASHSLGSSLHHKFALFVLQRIRGQETLQHLDLPTTLCWTSQFHAQLPRMSLGARINDTARPYRSALLRIRIFTGSRFSKTVKARRVAIVPCTMCDLYALPFAQGRDRNSLKSTSSSRDRSQLKT